MHELLLLKLVIGRCNNASHDNLAYRLWFFNFCDSLHSTCRVKIKIITQSYKFANSKLTK